jgi:enamine deaminase RidA (YjgF/YER057c/UK114 family)
MAAKFHNPPTVSLAGNYSLGAEIAGGKRLLFVSGQVGVDGKGRVLAGIDRQCAQVWKNIAAVLKSAGMGYGDIVKMNAYLTDSRFIPAYRTARDKVLKAPFPASTLVIVGGLASPDMLVEIEVVAAS